MSKYALHYVDSQREYLESTFTTENSFVMNFYLTDLQINDFRDWVTSEDEELTITDEDWEASGEAIVIRLEAFIGRNFFEPSTFYRVIGFKGPLSRLPMFKTLAKMDRENKE